MKKLSFHLEFVVNTVIVFSYILFSYILSLLYSLLAPRGGGGGEGVVVFNPPSGFSSVTFARAMISKRNFGKSNFNYDQIGGMIKFKTLPKILGRERCNIERIYGNLLQT